MGRGRGRVWQGIRGLFRSGDRTSDRDRSRVRPSSPGALSVVGATPDAIPLRGLARRAARERGGANELILRDAPLDPTGVESLEGVVAIDRASLSEERELLDFLAADIDPVPVDPVFRERLREELWSMVLDGQLAGSEES